MEINFNSPMQKVHVHGHTFFVKRDDMISGALSGNKARKLHFFLEKDLSHIDTIISYGGIQSNMMYALSSLARLKQKNFIYYTRHIPKQVHTLGLGNYHESLKNGMIVHDLKHDYDAFIAKLKSNDNTLLIHQGGHQIESKYGIDILAREIMEWAAANDIDDFVVFLPSGTGTTALYLQQSLGAHRVFTTNCVGGVEYLEKQFYELDKNLKHHPRILENKIFRFAEPHGDLMRNFYNLRAQTEIEFDLLYDAVGWHTLLNHLGDFDSNAIIYLHCGGILGNKSQMLRYEHKKIAVQSEGRI